MIPAKELREITRSSDSYLKMAMDDLEPKLKKEAEEGKSEYIYGRHFNVKGDSTTDDQKKCSQYSTFELPPMWKRMKEEFERLGYGFKAVQYFPKVSRVHFGVCDDNETDFAAQQAEIDRFKYYEIKITW